MNLPLFYLVLLASAAADSRAVENVVLEKLMQQGVKVSDGTVFRLPPPILADKLDAAGQKAAIAKTPYFRGTVEDFLAKSFYAPVGVKVRTLKRSRNKGPAVRAVDVWFVAHGDWDVLNAKDFLRSITGGKGGKGRIVSKSGVLTDREMAERKLAATDGDGGQLQYPYMTFSLFERVEVNATRRSSSTKGDGFLLAAGIVDPRFDKDPDYPNRWRALVRDAQAEIHPGPAHPFAHAGGYAKITRLIEPADAVFVECHLVYEEDYGWFDGANLVRQKVPVMVREQIRTFRRKLAVASKAKK